MQMRGPAPNYFGVVQVSVFSFPVSYWIRTVVIEGTQRTTNKHLCISLILSGSPSIHRSGLKTSTSSPKTALLRWMTHALTPTTVSSGKCTLHKSTPPAGTSRSRTNPVDGWMRIASLMTADLTCMCVSVRGRVGSNPDWCLRMGAGLTGRAALRLRRR